MTEYCIENKAHLYLVPGTWCVVIIVVYHYQFRGSFENPICYSQFSCSKTVLLEFFLSSKVVCTTFACSNRVSTLFHQIQHYLKCVQAMVNAYFEQSLAFLSFSAMVSMKFLETLSTAHGRACCSEKL